METVGHHDADEARDERPDTAGRGHLEPQARSADVPDPGEETEDRADEHDPGSGAVVDRHGDRDDSRADELDRQRPERQRGRGRRHPEAQDAHGLQPREDPEHHAEGLRRQLEDAAGRGEGEPVDGILSRPDDGEPGEHEDDPGCHDHGGPDGGGRLDPGVAQQGRERRDDGDDEPAGDLREEVRHAHAREEVLGRGGQGRRDEREHQRQPVRAEHDRDAQGQHRLGGDDGGGPVPEGQASDRATARDRRVEVETVGDLAHQGLKTLQLGMVGHRPPHHAQQCRRVRRPGQAVGDRDRVVGDVDVDGIQTVRPAHADDGQGHLVRRSADHEHRLADADRQVQDAGGEPLVDDREELGFRREGLVGVDESAQ